MSANPFGTGQEHGENVIRAGFETTDPRTGTRTLVVEANDERKGMGWVLEVECPAGAPPSILEHIHLGWTETFEIVEGSAKYRLAGQEHSATAGDSIVMPQGQAHVHPWNGGTTRMVYRQINDFGRSEPDAVGDVLGVFATINELAREGKLNARGLPKNPLQFAATLRTLVKHDGFDASAPIGLQRFISASLGRLAEFFGYRGVHDRYIQPM